MRLQKIVLKNGSEVVIDHDSKTKCRKCNREILWATTKKDKAMPVELVGLAEWESHFSTCEFANYFRKKT